MVPKQADAASSTRPSVIPLGCGGSLASLQAWRRHRATKQEPLAQEDSRPCASQALLLSAQPPCSSEGRPGHQGPRASTSPAGRMPSSQLRSHPLHLPQAENFLFLGLLA